MADNRAKFQFYETFENIVALLPVEEQLRFYKAIVQYGLFAKQPFFEGKDIAIFQPIKEAIDNQQTRKIKNAENGRLGGLAKSSNLKQNVANSSEKLEVKRNEVKRNEVEVKSTLYNNNFSIPTLDEVKKFCRDKGLKINPDKFYKYYSEKNWGMNDKWQTVAERWNENQRDDWSKKDDYNPYAAIMID